MFLQMNLTMAAHNTIVESVKSLHNYTLKNKKSLTDTMDVVFIAQTISNYLYFLDDDKNVSSFFIYL